MAKTTTKGTAPTLQETDLLATIRDYDKQIRDHQAILRQIPLAVLGPVTDEALATIRQKAAALALPSTELPQGVEEFTPGTKVHVSFSPLQQALVLGAVKNPETGKMEVTIVTRDGQFLAVTPEELRAMQAAPDPPDTKLSYSPAPLTGSTLGGEPQVSPSGIKPGDRVSTPLGSGTVVGRLPGPSGVWEVTGVPNSPVYLHETDLRVLTPPIPPSSPMVTQG